jgi:ornithine--oxo-acid transaminase
MCVFQPGDHGSTFGGNPLACAVARAAIRTLVGENLADRAAEMGNHMMAGLKRINSPHVKEVRGKGLLIGVEVKAGGHDAAHYCHELADHGVLCKQTAQYVIRFAPPLTIDKKEIDGALERVANVLR